MPNVQHSALTDPELHEPKGASTATNGEVYISDGAGSGSWANAESIEATKSLSGNGYVSLPGGTKMQWGSGTSLASSSITVTLPSSFTSTNYKVALTCFEDSGSDRIPLKVHTLTTTTFRVRQAQGSNVPFHWIAIGY